LSEPLAMNKTAISLVVVVAAIGASAAGYYFLTRTEVVRIEAPSAPSPVAGNDHVQRTPPNHGNFEKRFEPKPPPPNGGKLK
jgi:hypothetical protein